MGAIHNTYNNKYSASKCLSEQRVQGSIETTNCPSYRWKLGNLSWPPAINATQNVEMLDLLNYFESNDGLGFNFEGKRIKNFFFNFWKQLTI